VKKWYLYIVSLSILFPNVIYSQDKIVSSYRDFGKRIKELDTNHIEIDIQKNLAESISNNDTLGIICNQLSELKYFEMIEDYNRSLDIVSDLITISNQFKNDSLIALAYYYCGDAFYEINDMVDASKMLHKSVEYFIKAGKREWICKVDRILAIINMVAGKYDLAIADFKDYISKVKEHKFKLSVSGIYNNIGICYIYIKEYGLALNYLDTSYTLCLEEGDGIGVARIYNNKGTLFLEQGIPLKALNFFKKGHDLRKENKVGVTAYAESIINIGKAELSLGRVQDSKINFEKGLDLGKESSNKEIQKRALEGLKDVYFIQGNYKKAYELQKDYHQLVDSLYGHHVRDELIANEISSKFNNKIIKDSIALSQRELFHKEEIKHQKTLQEQKNAKNTIIKTFLVVVIIMIGLVMVFLYKRFKEKKRLNIVISKQKEELQQKQMEIVDSINYAKHLQDAILPSQSTIESILPKSFVFYQPKAIVAGDFYWVEKTSEKIIFAVADCTGHGVPGAMVSMICHGALNRAVREFQLLDTGLILEKTRDLVAEYFFQSEKDIRDGMDIAICSWDTNENTLQYSGANNPVWYVRDNTIKELKASKQTVGITPKYFPFETNEIQLKKNDVFYLFTDGFPDQFGGERGKKYKYKNFKQFLLSISKDDLKIQQNKISKEFSEWKRDFEQIDDVCVMGVRI